MSTKLKWTQRTKYLWEANIRGWVLEVNHMIPERPSVFQYTWTITSPFTPQRGLWYASVEEAQISCEEALIGILKAMKIYAQEVLDELET